MPFGLKNARASYQRLVNKIFIQQIGRNMEVYVNDMLIKSKEELTHLDDLKETFATLKKYQMRLNSSKCVFGVVSRKFLGFMVSQKGIEANPEKVQAIINIASPRTVKEVQKLTGRIAALNKFVSRATDKCVPFFNTLKQAFAWTEECEAAFQELKRYLSIPPLLSPSKEGEDLYLYLAVSAPVVSAALIREEGKKQLPVYYVSQAFQGAESRTAIKAQALADFIAKFIFSNEDSLTDEVEHWTIQTDGSSAQRRGGVGVVITTLNGKILKYGVQLKFLATNNKAEYEGILTGLRLGKALGAKDLLVQNNSKLVIGQIRGEYEAKEERMQKYLRLTKHLTQEFDTVEFVQIPRSQNMAADEVSKLASSEEGEISMDLAMEVKKHPSIEEVPTFIIQSANSWMTPIISFLQDGHLPQNTKEAKKIRKRAAKFTILNDALYKRGFSMPYLKCVVKEEARYILEEIHGGVCGDHAGLRSLINKWVEVKALTTITKTRIRSFLWKNIICRFGIPLTVISNNGRQFDNQGFRDFCSNLGIKN
ncbi:uncharacterized protein LOC126708547 [Quercus robur]|uniref:uncharacterized protein LOC126708547 n=1 Tax=Quercus robur TaxID=38942 RepID=UPI002162CB04|nr:uncharacterized protein LOC126708547 [Quercus robur]